MQKFYCDICGKELDEKQNIRLSMQPVTWIDSVRYRAIRYEMTKVDVCSDCLPRLKDTTEMIIRAAREKNALESVATTNESK